MLAGSCWDVLRLSCEAVCKVLGSFAAGLSSEPEAIGSLPDSCGAGVSTGAVLCGCSGGGGGVA